MEQARLILAIALSFLVIVLWEVLFVKKEPVSQAPQGEVTETTTTQTTLSGTETTTPPDTAPATTETAPVLTPIEPSSSPILTRRAREINVETPFYSAVFTEKGAGIKSFKLKDYKDNINPDSPLKEMAAEGSDTPTILSDTAGGSLTGMKYAIYTASEKQDDIQLDQSARDLGFTWTSPEGIVVEKRYHLDPDTYLLNMSISFTNRSGVSLSDRLILSLVSMLPQSNNRYGFQGPSAFIDNDLKQVKIKSIDKTNSYTGVIDWVAYETSYFMSSIVPKEKVKSSMRLLFHTGDLLETQYMLPVTEFKPGETQTFKYDLYLGPKSLKILGKMDNTLVRAINFGWFDLFAKAFLRLMNFLHQYIPNYGISIIILTLLIKVVLWPLGNMGYKSMNQMKKIQPLMTEIREKYKDDKRRMNEELMSLYKTYKINPMGGCLPMVLQIPVFIAFYRMLYGAVELRHAPFVGWINDLSAPDRLFHFNFEIPLMQPPYGIPVLTIVMGITMFLQQKMSPPPGDPAQAKMMMLLPIVFTFIFINFPSGLVVYWLVNNIVSIGQQYYIGKKNA